MRDLATDKQSLSVPPGRRRGDNPASVIRGNGAQHSALLPRFFISRMPGTPGAGAVQRKSRWAL